MEIASPHRNGFSRRAESVDDGIVRQVLMLCAVTIVAGNVACGGAKLASPTDGSTDRRDASGDVAMDAGPRGLAARFAGRTGRARRPGDTRDGAAEIPAADTITDGADDAADVRVDAGDGPGDSRSPIGRPMRSSTRRGSTRRTCVATRATPPSRSMRPPMRSWTAPTQAMPGRTVRRPTRRSKPAAPSFSGTAAGRTPASARRTRAVNSPAPAATAPSHVPRAVLAP